MPGLRDAARASIASQSRKRGLWSRKLPADSALIRSKVVGPGSSRPRREAEPLALVQGRLLEQARSGATSTISRNDLRRVADAVWDGPAPLATDARLLQRVLGEIEQRRARPAVRNLIGVYLIGFGPERPAIGPFSNWLDATVPAFDWIWSQRAKELSLFSRTAGPIAVARRLLDTSKSIQGALDDCGLEAPRDSGGFAEAAFHEACKLTLKAPAAELVSKQTRLIAWGQVAREGMRAELRFKNLWEPLAAGLFCPWSKAEPPDTHKALIVDFAITAAGDPRTTPRLWQKEESEAQAILRRWLTKTSFRQFFTFVDKTAFGPHWEYRKAFWSAWLDAGYISNAWVAFGSDAAHLASQAAVRSKDESLRQFGRANVSGRSAQQSALLMQIGNLTIVDWSHNGKCSLWGSRRAPKLFRAQYSGQDFPADAAIDAISHMQSENFGWQSKVASLIRDETGFRTDNRKWRPR